MGGTSITSSCEVRGIRHPFRHPTSRAAAYLDINVYPSSSSQHNAIEEIAGAIFGSPSLALPILFRSSSSPYSIAVFAFCVARRRLLNRIDIRAVPSSALSLSLSIVVCSVRSRSFPIPFGGGNLDSAWPISQRGTIEVSASLSTR